MVTFDITPGTRVTRDEIDARFGGGTQGGMLTPRVSGLIFLYSDPKSSETYGYTTDGWADDEHTRYSYTGHGRIGPQSADKGKNKTLLESINTGREVHLFLAVGTAPGRQARIHEYLGQFIVDPADPWRPETTLDEAHEPRTVVVFNLIRVDGPYQLATPAATESDRPAQATTATTIEREASNQLEVQRPAVAPLTAARRERELEDKLIAWLSRRGQSAKRQRIRVAGERGSLFTDTWVPESRTLFEVKGDATRSDVRMAVAQLLDYRRHVTPTPLKAAVVVPIAPTQDVQAFVREVGLSLAVFDTRGLTYLVEQ